MQIPSPARTVTLVALLTAGCTGQTTLPSPDCAVQKQPAADYGAPTPLSQTSSVNVEIKGSYVGSRVRKLLADTLPATATDQELAVPEGQPGYIRIGGVVVKGVRLQEKTVGSVRLNLLQIQIAPWLRGQERVPQQPDRWKLSKVEIQRLFELRLRLAPRLVTPATVPDAARRRALLQCGNDPACGGSGAIVPLELHELYDSSYSEVVACTSPTARNAHYDVLVQRVHQGVLDALYGTGQQEGAPPLVLPGQTIVDLVSGIAGAPVQLTGIAFGTDQDLKLGFLFNQGSPMPFDPNTSLVMYPQADWGVMIDKSFITAAITKKVTDQAAANVPPVTVGAVSVTYESWGRGSLNLISVSAPATAATLLCSVPVSIRATISPRIRRNAQNRSVLTDSTVSSAVPQVTACIVYERLLFGSATMKLCTPGPCAPPPPPDPCPAMAEVQFQAGPGDVFYGIGMDTDNVFYIAGRSTFIDSILNARAQPPRTPVPTCP